MDFSPLSDKDIEIMMESIKIGSIDDLFSDIPEKMRNPPLNLPEGLSEMDTLMAIRNLSKKNTVFDAYFCGAGCYNHYIPPVVGQLVNRNEFYTSYTPYQAEISQGFLQAIFEYQTSICNLTGMDATNASVYDGATAAAESLLMAKNITRKNKFLILQPFNPDYQKVLRTYATSCEFSLDYTSEEDLEKRLSDGVYGAIMIQNPNFLGGLLDISSIISSIKRCDPKVLIIYLTIEPTSLGLLKRPGTQSVDIVCGEGQSIGLPMAFGGPGLGFMSTTKKHMRKLPGRIVGKTKELNGKGVGYILTLQAREQHIRREKALSNICSNEALCMLAVQIYLSAMGYLGLRQIAEINIRNTHYLKKAIREIKGYELLDSNNPSYNEFAVLGKKGVYKKLIELCLSQNICPPYLIEKDEIDAITRGTELKILDSKDLILICNTEMNEQADIDKLIWALKESIQ